MKGASFFNTFVGYICNDNIVKTENNLLAAQRQSNPSNDYHH